MNKAELINLERIAYNTYLRYQLSLNLHILHLKYMHYFRTAFTPGNGHSVPFYHSPRERKNAISWFYQLFEGQSDYSRLKHMGAKYVE